MEEDLAQLKHSKILENQKKVAEENAKIYYENKGESLRNSYGLAFDVITQKGASKNSEFRSPDSGSSKPPKYPSPFSGHRKEENKYDDIDRELGFDVYQEKLEGSQNFHNRNYLENKHMQANKFQRQSLGSNMRRDMESETSTFSREEENQDEGESQPDPAPKLSTDEVENIQKNIRSKFLAAAQSGADTEHTKLVQKLQSFRRDRSVSPANQEARHHMEDIIRHRKEGNIRGLPKPDQRFYIEEDVGYQSISAKFLNSRRNKSPAKQNVFAKAVERSRSPKMTPNLLNDILAHISERSELMNKNKSKLKEGDRKIAEDFVGKLETESRHTRDADKDPKLDAMKKQSHNTSMTFQEILQRNVDESADIHRDQDDTIVVDQPEEGLGAGRGGKFISLKSFILVDRSFNDLALSKLSRDKMSKSFQDGYHSPDKEKAEPESRQRQSILKRAMTDKNFRSRGAMNVSFSLEELARKLCHCVLPNLGGKLEESKLSLNRANDISISFDKEEYAREKLVKNSKIMGVIEKAHNNALKAQYFNVWKDAFLEDKRRQEAIRIEKERKLSNRFRIQIHTSIQ